MVDEFALAEALTQGSGASFSLGVRRRMPDGLARFSARELLRKDVDILATVGGEAGAELGALGVAAEAALRRLGDPS